MSVRRRDWRGRRSSAEAEDTTRHRQALLVRFLSASGVFHSLPGTSARDRSRPSTWCFVSNRFRAIPPDSAEIPSSRPEKRGVRGSTPRLTTTKPLVDHTIRQGLRRVREQALRICPSSVRTAFVRTACPRVPGPSSRPRTSPMLCCCRPGARANERGWATAPDARTAAHIRGHLGRTAARSPSATASTHPIPSVRTPAPPIGVPSAARRDHALADLSSAALRAGEHRRRSDLAVDMDAKSAVLFPGRGDTTPNDGTLGA
jgi:hypothetical protein